MAWLDRKGALVSTLAEPAPWASPRVSPDGRRVALTRTDLQTGHRQRVGDRRRRRRPRPPHAGGRERRGTRLVPRRQADRLPRVPRRTDVGIYVRPAGGGAAELLVSMNGLDSETLDRLPDGSRIVFSRWNAAGGNYDICCVDVGSKKADGHFSRRPPTRWRRSSRPTERLLAYTLRQSGTRSDVYLWRLGGRDALAGLRGGEVSRQRWRKDGKELFFVGHDARLRSVAVGSEPGGAPGTPRVVFERRLKLNQYFSYDVAPGRLEVPRRHALSGRTRRVRATPPELARARAEGALKTPAYAKALAGL